MTYGQAYPDSGAKTPRIYYQDEWVTLWHGDCLQVDAWLEADVLITDPPYGVDGHLSAGWKGKRPPAGHSRTNAKPQWDTSLEARDAALRLWGDRPYAVFASPARLDAAVPHRGFPLVWDKGSVGMGDTDFPWGRGYELIYVNGDGWRGKRESPVIRSTECLSNPHGLVARTGHPSPKPEALMEVLVAKAPPGVIADPFSGSGSTLVAARNLGRMAVGVEIDERYCETTARRLAQDVLDFGALA